MMKQQVVAVMRKYHRRTSFRAPTIGSARRAGWHPGDVLANRLHLQRNALYKLLHDARQKLKQGLAQEGYEGADLLSLFE
ncbi:MAG: hypothetical protein R3B96_04865 [Pirellulaceae bacterium]